MITAKKEVETMLTKLPDNCSLEDIQYHLYVLGKIRHGVESAEKETFSQEEVEQRFNQTQINR